MNDDHFSIKDCAIISIATGKKAINVKELFDQLLKLEEDSIYYHFWGKLLRTSYSTPEFNNDFAQWVNDEIHDKVLAEKLSVLEPQYYDSIEILRQEILDIIQTQLEQNTVLLYTNSKKPFYFLRYGLIIFNTDKIATAPIEFVGILPNLSLGSVYFHFVDARRRTQNRLDDFSNWIIDFPGYNDLVNALVNVDPFFLPLSKTKEIIVKIFQHYFK